MPELPECEAQRRMLERCAVGRVITSLCATEQGTGARAGDFDDKIFDEGADAAAVEEALVGRRVAAARRRGKQIWLAFDDGSALLLHLGMTGSCVVLGEATPSYKAFQVDQAWPPKYCKLEVVLDDGGKIAYADPRRFGRLRLRKAGAVEASPPISALARDALSPPPVAAMAAALAARKAPIKAVLLDQGALVAGVGNWVADDVLRAAGLHPATRADALDGAQVAALRGALVSVCGAAVDANADASKFPADWLFHFRWGKQTTGSVATPFGRVHFDTIAGRTTAFLPAVQRRTAAAAAPAKKRRRGGDGP